MNWKYPYKEGLNGVVGKSTTKRKACCGLMENISNIMRWQPATNGNNWLLGSNKTCKTSFTKRIHWELGSLISTMIATTHRKSFRWNPIQDNYKKETMGLHISFLTNSFRDSSWIKNAITPSQKIREKEFHLEMQDKEYLRSSNKNLEEHFEKELTPWRTSVYKGMIKRNEGWEE